MCKILSIFLFSFILASCSNKQLYQAGQDYQKSKCVEEAGSEQQHNDCLNLDEKTFEEYDKQRKNIINKKRVINHKQAVITLNKEHKTL